ncbi:MAG: mechanosensitive ion channel, partial [Calditrichaeota bacterium]|nr:mechanosensitive ion channel [Calditrichota bacterium]
TRRYLLRFLSRLAAKSKTEIDDAILDKVIYRRLAYVAPILVIYAFLNLTPDLEIYLKPLLLALMALIVLLSAGAFLNQIGGFLQDRPLFRGKPIKSYVQVVKLIIYLMGAILVIGLLTNSSPLALLSGLGAMTAVLLFIFRDTILSFIASIQITANDLVRVGDWIEVRKYGADGDVIDIALHVVKIQNWDKTISVIPTHKLIDETFINWRGMQQSGGRRI